MHTQCVCVHTNDPTTLQRAKPFEYNMECLRASQSSQSTVQSKSTTTDIFDIPC